MIQPALQSACQAMSILHGSKQAVRRQAMSPAGRRIKLALPPNAIDSAIQRNRAMFIMDQVGSIGRHRQESILAKLKEYGAVSSVDPMTVTGKFSFGENEMAQPNGARWTAETRSTYKSPCRQSITTSQTPRCGR
jgi:hypothetical protein